jgi:hypothetical protein
MVGDYFKLLAVQFGVKVKITLVQIPFGDIRIQSLLGIHFVRAPPSRTGRSDHAVGLAVATCGSYAGELSGPVFKSPKYVWYLNCSPQKRREVFSCKDKELFN